MTCSRWSSGARIPRQFPSSCTSWKTLSQKRQKLAWPFGIHQTLSHSDNGNFLKETATGFRQNLFNVWSITSMNNTNGLRNKTTNPLHFLFVANFSMFWTSDNWHSRRSIKPKAKLSDVLTNQLVSNTCSFSGRTEDMEEKKVCEPPVDCQKLQVW